MWTRLLERLPWKLESASLPDVDQSRFEQACYEAELEVRSDMGIPSDTPLDEAAREKVLLLARIDMDLQQEPDKTAWLVICLLVAAPVVLASGPLEQFLYLLLALPSVLLVVRIMGQERNVWFLSRLVSTKYTRQHVIKERDAMAREVALLRAKRKPGAKRLVTPYQAREEYHRQRTRGRPDGKSRAPSQGSVAAGLDVGIDVVSRLVASGELEWPPEK